MEQHLRIALCMVFFIGHLQAAPLTSTTAQTKPLCFNMADLGLNLLGKYVTCDPSVNFTSPSNVTEPCYAAALKSFQDGLHGASNCTGQLWRIGNTARALGLTPITTKTPEGPVDSSDCKWENQPFPVFVKDFETFAKQVNSGC